MGESTYLVHHISLGMCGLATPLLKAEISARRVILRYAQSDKRTLRLLLGC